ncbi:hypothetical protein CUT44_27625 [Streptomyces carminius]|uniref:Cobalt transporter n=1 Tax=Streptomyces carminius TaxID=2665496 RepID=A0A2M8LQ67_9ACTN|nr:hypothetical protein CUT44_27625 [Streptomyces carminius]
MTAVTSQDPVRNPAARTADRPVLPLLRRGLAAGGPAGLAAGLFSLLLAEPLMDRAIAQEAERHAHAHDATGVTAHHEELFSRGTQHFGLVVTAVVVGLALGVFFAVAYALLHRSGALTERPWNRSLLLAGAGFTALSLLPGLRYPANPPGVGDGGTVQERQVLWLAALAVGVLGMLLARQLHRRLADREAPVRQLAVAGVVVATGAALFLLPGNPDPVPVDARLLWDFRMLSLASHAVLWAALGIAFGLLGLRAARAAGAGGAAGKGT